MEPLSPDHETTRGTRAATGSALRVVALGLLGYAYVIGLVVALSAATVGTALLVPSTPSIIWLTISLALLSLGVFRSLWVRSPEPVGRRLEPHEAPGLFDLIHDLRKELRAPRIHDVYLDGGSFNAGIAQYPRLGMFGPSRNVLVVGLPLMLGVTVDELRAVLAHELGHVSRRHGRTSAWIYRLRITWERVGLQVETLGAWGALLFRPFVRWYAPRFDRASLALARTHEYEADEAAMLATGAETAASTLSRLAVSSALLTERFWPELWKRADREPAPPPLLLQHMSRALQGAGEDPDADLWLAAALDEEPVGETTHPPLRARLAALGVDPERARPRPARVTTSAADTLLGGEWVDELMNALDIGWQEDAGPTWREQHEEARQGEARLAELEARGGWEQLPVDDLREYAGLVSRFRGLEAARSAWTRVLDLEPGAGVALLALGELAAEQGDAGGHDLLEEAARLEPLYAPHALSARATLLARQGRRDEAAACRRRAAEAESLVHQAHFERSRLVPTDDLAEHGLPPWTVEHIAAVFDRSDIARAYLARKAPEALADHYPVYVIGYVRKGRLGYERRGAKGGLEAELFAELQDVMPGPFWLADLTEDSSRLRRRLSKVPEACIAHRGVSARPLARAAPVLVGLLVVGALIAGISGVDKPGKQPSTPNPADVSASTGNALQRWAALAEDSCLAYRTHATLRLEDVLEVRGDLDFAERWAVLRPFERQLITGLRAPPHIDEGDAAVDLLARDLRRLDRIADDYADGRRKAAEARLARFVADDRTERAFAALGVHACAPTATLAR